MVDKNFGEMAEKIFRFSIIIVTLLILFCFIIDLGGAKTLNVSVERGVSKNINKENIGSFGAKDSITFWSEETKRYFTNTGSKLNIDRFTYVKDYNLFEGWILIHSNRTQLCTIVDVFGGGWKRITLKKGDNLLNFSDIGEYGGLRILSIGTVNGFGLVKAKRDPFHFEDYPIAILKSELGKFTWEKAAIAVVVAAIGCGWAYYVKRRLLINANVYKLIYMVIPCVLILIALGVNYSNVEIQISENVTRQVPSLTWSSYNIKDMWNWALTLFFAGGYAAGLYISKFEYFTVVIPLMDRFSIIRLPYNKELKIIRDIDGKLAKVRVENEGKLKIDLNGEEVEAVVSTDRKQKDEDRSTIEFNSKTAMFSAALFGLLILANFLNVFKIDLMCSFLILGTTALIFNISTIKEVFSRIEREVTIISTRLITNDRYAADLLNGKLKEMAKAFETLRKDLIRKEFEVDVKLVKEVLDVTRSLKPVPKADEVKAEAEGDE
ncbi:hypothetical protein DRP05_14575 [Archaeoglobales archaeon]|nr:MAG: hypothetical protein DRP05_14575 [Archaeoglobales archaeon]